MGANRGRPRIFICLFSLGAFALEAAAASPALTYRVGVIEVKGPKEKFWRLLPESRSAAAPQESFRTAAGAMLGVLFEDGSRLELLESAVLSLRKLDAEALEVELLQGGLHVQVKRSPTRMFLVRASAGLLKTRGAQFMVKAMDAGRVVLDVEQGVVAAADLRGQEVLVYPNERLALDRFGMRPVEGRPSLARITKERFRQAMRRERAFSVERDLLRAQAAEEAKRPEFEQGRILTDNAGARVRQESYVIRPRADQLKWVVLNLRSTGFSYQYYLATFNQALPVNLNQALRQIPGGAGNAPSFFLTDLTVVSSNLHDSIVETAQGGHQVDVNNNNDASDDAAVLFDPGRNAFSGVAGQNVYLSLFDRYGLYVNGVLKYGWTGADIRSYAKDATLSVNTDPITGAPLAQDLPLRVVSATFPDLARAHRLVYHSYGDGSFLQYDGYSLDPEGRAVSLDEFGGPVSGASYEFTRLRFNYQRIATAGEFQGRSIDLMVEPRITTLFGILP